MAKYYALALIIGALLGFAVGNLSAREDAPAPADSGLDDRIARLQQEVADLRRGKEDAETARGAAEAEREAVRRKLETARVDAEREVARLTKALAAAAGGDEEAEVPDEAAPEAAIDVAGLKDASRAFGAAVQTLFMGGDTKEEQKALREAFARASPETMKAFIEEFRSTGDLGVQFLMAHALAQSGRPEAIAALRETLADADEGYFVRRVASHGLAFSDADGIEADLERAARHDADTGVRANSAFGLTHRGHPDGARLYGEAMDAAFAKDDPEAINYVYSLNFLGEKGKPVIRERLLTYTNKRARLVLIDLSQRAKDVDALSALDRIAQTDEDAEIREAAEKAARAIRGQ